MPQDCSLLFLLNLFLSLLNLGKLLLQALIFILDTLFELDFGLSQASLLLNQSGYYDDFVLLDAGVLLLSIKLVSLLGDFVDLFLVLTFLIVELFNLSAQGGHQRLKLLFLRRLLANTRLEFLDL